MTKFTDILREADRVLCAAKASLGRESSAQSAPTLTPEQQELYRRMDAAFGGQPGMGVRKEGNTQMFGAVIATAHAGRAPATPAPAQRAAKGTNFSGLAATLDAKMGTVEQTPSVRRDALGAVLFSAHGGSR